MSAILKHVIIRITSQPLFKFHRMTNICSPRHTTNGMLAKLGSSHLHKILHTTSVQHYYKNSTVLATQCQPYGMMLVCSMQINVIGH